MDVESSRRPSNTRLGAKLSGRRCRCTRGRNSGELLWEFRYFGGGVIELAADQPQALLVSTDADLIDQVRSAFSLFDGELHICGTTREAFRAINRKSLSAILIDFDLDDGGALAIRRVANSTLPDCPLILLGPEKMQAAWVKLFECTHTVDKTLAVLQVERLLKKLGWTEPGASPARSVPKRRLSRVEVPKPKPASTAPVAAEVAASVSHLTGQTEHSELDVDELSIRYHEPPSAERAISEQPDEADLEADATMETVEMEEFKPPPPAPEVPAASEPVPVRLLTRFDLRGDVALTPYSSILYKLFANRLTGVLILGLGEDTRSVFVLGGVPVNARSRRLSDALGKHVIRCGFATKPQIERALRMQRPGSRLGESLVTYGVLSPKDLSVALSSQVHDICLSGFETTQCPYEFAETDKWVGDYEEFPQNPIGLIVDGVRISNNPNRLANELNPHLGEYVVKTEKFHEFLRFLPATEQQWNWISAIDGATTLRRLTVLTQEAVIDFLNLIYALRAADIIDFSELPRPTCERSWRKEPVTDNGADTGAFRTEEENVRTIESAVAHYLTLADFGDPRVLLEVRPDATAEDVRSAYIKARKMLRAGQFNLLAPTALRNAQTIFGRIKEAYNTVLTEIMAASSPKQGPRRSSPAQQTAEIERITNQGRERISSQGTAPEKKKQAAIFSSGGMSTNTAIIHYKEAHRLADEESWLPALDEIRLALEQLPNDVRFIALESWIRFNLPSRDVERVRELCISRLSQVIQSAPQLADAHYYLGRILQSQQRFGEALSCYEMVKTLGQSRLDLQLRITRILQMGVRPESLFSNPSHSGLGVPAFEGANDG